MNFEDMNAAGESGTEFEYDFEDFATIDFEVGTTVIGELLAILEDVGQYNSRVYLLNNDEGRKVMFWGNGSINAAVDNTDDLEEGDTLAVRKSEETYENEHGEFHQYDVRYSKSIPEDEM